ncbi:MAG TPA: glutamyl-tRNA reductase [Candidatus Kapabacteria bacterium]|nr:glutamyl-tRNA reductase [Candidatus Kapabacteria bacterium]
MPSKLIAVGISHHSVPVEYREKVALSESETRQLLERLKDSFTDEALVISTCNRSEIYVRPTNNEVSSEFLIDLLLESKNVPLHDRNIFKEKFTRLSYCDAITHLFEVIASVDSQVFGDQQIFAQVKDSFRISEETGACGTFMTKLAHAAFRVAKRVRNETNITIGAGTVSYAAVEFARKVYDDLKDRTALIIGAGETASLAASYLVERGIRTIHVANRTVENAESLLEQLRGQAPLVHSKALTLTELRIALADADIIISSTSGREIILDEAQMKQALRERRDPSPVVIIDIAVPRDIDPKIASLPNVFLKDIDDLSAIVDQNLEKRKADLPKIKAIINEEFEVFLDVLSRLEVGPTIAELRGRFERIRQAELELHRNGLSPEAFDKLDEMTRKMFNRLLHTPTVMLKAPRTSKDDLQARIETIRLLFALDEQNTSKNE